MLATVSNLYGYGTVTAPITESTPLRPTSDKGQIRAQLWADALARHQAGRVRVIEVRASDDIGPGSQSHLGDRVLPRLPAGKSVQVLPRADVEPSWTYIEDAARLLVVVAQDERAWGHAWHVPTNPPRTQRQAIADLARVAGTPPVKVGEVPAVVLRMLALFNPTLRELREIAYQFAAPFVIDGHYRSATSAQPA